MAYMIWVTGACNLRCKYCYEGIKKTSCHMTKKTAYKTFDFIKKDFKLTSQQELLVNFHGGEPFLRMDIMEYFINSLKQYFDNKCKVVFSTTTNATLLSAEAIRFIVKNNMDITVSLDGKKEFHDQSRVFMNGSGSFEKALHNSLKLLEENKNLRVRMTVNTDNVIGLSDNIEFLVQQGFKVIVPGIDIFDKRWDEESVKILKKEIQKAKKMYINFPDIRISLCEPLNYCGAYCSVGKNTKHIYYNGNIYPCTVVCGNDEFYIGNIKYGIDEKKIEKMQKNIYTGYKICKECDLKGYCSAARCILINKLVTGNYQRPTEIECNLTHILYEVNGCEIN